MGAWIWWAKRPVPVLYDSESLTCGRDYEELAVRAKIFRVDESLHRREKLMMDIDGI